MNASSLKVLVFGGSGKVGSALSAAFMSAGYTVVSLNSSVADVGNHDQVCRSIMEVQPDIVLNAAACNGIDACEDAPQKALLINTLFPKLLAELSVQHGFLLVHISSDAVFGGTEEKYYLESSNASPINIYGFTKYGGDCFVSAIAQRYYIVRISVQFGVTFGKGQFVEKMLEKIRNREGCLKVSDDIIASPSYSRDVAERIRELVEQQSPFGVYHVANDGKASLYELVKELVNSMESDVAVEPVPHTAFPSRGLKNIYTPIRSEKIPPLRPWRDALQAYCRELQQQDKGLIDG